jgi:hypothetical protein
VNGEHPYSFTGEQVFRIYSQNRLLKKALLIAGERRDENQALLHAALHELAIARGEKSVSNFIATWQHQHRKLDREGLPFYRR